MVLEEFDIEGKTAIVTGAARGIGKGIALTLADAGVDVVVTDVLQEPLEETAAEIQQMGRKSLAVVTDVRKTEQVENMVEATVDHLGKIDILVANAGVEAVKPVVLVDGDKSPAQMRVDARFDSGLTDEEWDWMLDVNLRGYARCARAVGPHMLKQKSGKIIGIGSIAGMRYGANTTAYAAAKAGVHRFTQALAQEWAGYDINVNAIAPGAFPTPIWSENLKNWNVTAEENEKSMEMVSSFTPLQRDTGGWGSPREMGLLVVFLASKASSFMTGQILVADGGVSL